jgi:hypothetical protein
MIKTNIRSMPIPERIILMEEIWDSLCQDTEEVRSPLWHKNILDERMELIQVRQF